ncbi:MAG: hypothetical protein ACK4MG_04200 [Aquabacterium sp.]|uniref:hypothetical protein n=1 Tax=uncultured Aquabacterium sp. TaxID=158753 RepID=UPI0025E1FADD|nr:hypothetical protein [uncultured Aquabacterium sp.]
MPMNGFTVGRDVSLSVVTANGPLRLTLITGFSAKPNTAETRVKGLDGVTRYLRFPDGWSGSFDVERQDSTVDDYFAQLEANYYAGINEQPATITETITEPNGSVTQWRYTGVLLKLEDAGTFQGDQTVKQRLSWVAARKIKLA